jgi:hypothetical protein
MFAHQYILSYSYSPEKIINRIRPEPANKANISPLMKAVIRNMKLAELVENYDHA